MNAPITLLIFLASVFSFGSSFKCYQCENCDTSFLKSITTEKTECTDVTLGVIGQRCMKTIDGEGAITRSCSNQALCIPAMARTCSKEITTNCGICCEEENCNSANTSVISLATLFFSLLAYLRFF